MSVQFQNAYHFKRDNVLLCAAEGMYSGQFIYAGKKAKLHVGNILPLSALPEGTLICNIESSPGDRGKIARASGDYATVVTQDFEKVRSSPTSNLARYAAVTISVCIMFHFIPNAHSCDVIHSRAPLAFACPLAQSVPAATFAVPWWASLLAVDARISPC